MAAFTFLSPEPLASISRTVSIGGRGSIGPDPQQGTRGRSGPADRAAVASDCVTCDESSAVQRHLELELPSQNGSDLIGGGVAGQSGAGIQRPTLSATKSTNEPCSWDGALACGRCRSRGRYERAAHQRVASRVPAARNPESFPVNFKRWSVPSSRPAPPRSSLRALRCSGPGRCWLAGSRRGCARGSTRAGMA